MLRKLGLVDFHKALKDKIEDNTGLRAFDAVPENQPAPFYFIEIVDKRPEDTKTMFCEVFTVWAHAVAREGNSKLDIYQLIQDLEEALSEELELPDGISLLRQTSTGIQTLQQDETKEWHAIVTFEFKVSYGFKTKN